MFNVGLYKMSMGHAISIDKNQVVARGLPDRLVQYLRLSESPVLLPYMLEMKYPFEISLHILNEIAGLFRTSIVGYQNFEWQLTLPRKAQKGKFEGFWAIISWDNDSRSHVLLPFQPRSVILD